MWSNPQETADFVTVTEKILNEKLHFYAVRALKEIIMAEVSRHVSEYVYVINGFHDVNSTLYIITKIHPKAGILLKVVNVFRSETLNFIQGRKQSQHQRKYNKQKLRNKMEGEKNIQGCTRFK